MHRRFVNYAVMISILNNNRETLIDGNGSAGWSGATVQSYNTNAASWALAKNLYKTGAPYAIVPIGIAIGFGLVAVHRAIAYVGSHASWILPQMLTLLPRSSFLASVDSISTSEYFVLDPNARTDTCTGSTSLPSSNSLVTFRTTSPKPALSSAGSLAASTFSTISVTTNQCGSRTTCIWLLALLMVLRTLCCLSCPSQSLELVERVIQCRNGGATMSMATTIGARLEIVEEAGKCSWIVRSSIANYMSSELLNLPLRRVCTFYLHRFSKNIASILR